MSAENTQSTSGNISTAKPVQSPTQATPPTKEGQEDDTQKNMAPKTPDAQPAKKV